MRKCARCGQPQQGFAGASIGGKQAYYCHPDEGPDCYTLSSREGFPELTGKVSTPLGRMFAAIDVKWEDLES
jgi:hypothetical protein